jgi:hypothetical protein
VQAYLGHKNIQPTDRYTELAPDRFNDFWRELLPLIGVRLQSTSWNKGGCLNVEIEYVVLVLRPSAPLQ